VSDLVRLVADLTTASGRAKAQASVVLTKTAADIEAAAKQLAPVDTGALKNSIGWEMGYGGDDLTVEIGPTVEYGAHVEYGTVNMAPHAYMGPAFDLHSPAFEQAMGVVVEQF
jgi:HK97 gp10 family phage protein